MVGLWCAMSATRDNQPFSLSKDLSTHEYVKYFQTPVLNMVPIMRQERLLKKTMQQLTPF